MIKKPLISVILPVYNAEKYINDSIDSILAQTYLNFEFIIINDGSTDSSSKIIETYAKTDPRIIVKKRENKGLIYSLNEGIEISKGEFIARMDADDISLPNRFEEQIKAMKNGADICGCHFLHIDKENKKTRTKLVPLNTNSFLINLALTVPFAHGSIMMRKSFLTENKLKYGDSSFKSAEDYTLWIKMYEKGAKFYNVDDFHFLYRDYSSSLSKGNKTKLKKDAYLLSSNFIKKNSKELIRSIDRLLTTSLTEDEKDNIMGCSLYLLRHRKSSVFFKVIRVIPTKNTITNFLKFLTGRFF